MNQLERAVVDLATAYQGTDRLPLDLAGAVDALLAYRASLDPLAGEDRTWGEVAEGDQVFIPRTNRWWLVIESRRGGDGRMRIIAQGAPKILTPDPGTPVKIRRAASGKAVDLLNSILISGPSSMVREVGDDDSPT